MYCKCQLILFIKYGNMLIINRNKYFTHVCNIFSSSLDLWLVMIWMNLLWSNFKSDSQFLRPIIILLYKVSGLDFYVYLHSSPVVEHLLLVFFCKGWGVPGSIPDLVKPKISFEFFILKRFSLIFKKNKNKVWF